jgi:hypothetical protein
MRRRTIYVDRLVTAAIAIALLAAGIFTILWRLDVTIANKAMAHASQRWYTLAPQQSWWDWTLGGIAAAACVAGLWLVIANLRRNRLNAVELDGTGDIGTVTISVSEVGKAAAKILERHHTVHSASATTVLERGQPTVRITVVSDSAVSLAHVRRFAVETEADLRAALVDLDVTLQMFVRYETAHPRRPRGHG